jgi:signal peptidase I
MASTTTRKETAMTTTNPTPVTQPVIWRGEAGWRFAFVEHDGNAYTLRNTPTGIDVLVDFDGDDVRIAQVDTEAEALDYISHHAYQVIG